MVILHSRLPRSRSAAALAHESAQGAPHESAQGAPHETARRSARPARRGPAGPVLTLVPSVPAEPAESESPRDPSSPEGAGQPAVSASTGGSASGGRPSRCGAPGGAIDRGRRALREAGMATAEYAIATLAAVGFAGLLLVILRSGEVRALLMGLVKRALSVSS